MIAARGWGIAALVLLAPASALAQGLGVTAEVEAPIAATGGDDPTASATAIDAQDRPQALDTLEDALREAPGARPLSTGAYGSPTTVSLRGSDADQVEVLFGELPITTADGSAFDLSTVPLWALDRVEVYRGGTPTWLGAGGMGGAIRLVPRDAEAGTRLLGTAGMGSWELFHGRVGASVGSRDVSWTTAVGGTTSEGDFPYGADLTLLDGGPETTRRRTNGWLREGAGLGHLRLRVGDGHLSAFAFGLERVGGVPGPAARPTRRAHRNETHLLGAVGYEVTEGGRRPEDADWRVALTASVAHRRRRLSDPNAEVALVPTAADDGAFRSVLRAAASGRPAPWLELTGVALWTHEALDPEDRLARQPNASSARDAGTFALEGRLSGRVDDVRMELRPSARLQVVGSRLAELRPGRADRHDALELAPTFRVGAAIEPVRGLAIAASAASATRMPTMVELFGDRGYLVGDAGLRPERAHTFDLGVVLRGRAGPVSGQAELRGFATVAEDLIRYRRNSQYQAVPENVEGETILSGGELGVRGRVTRHLTLVGALTLLETWTPHGPADVTRRLPLRPWLTAYVRPTAQVLDAGAFDRLALWAELTHVSEAFWDPANTSALPARTLVGVGVSAETAARRIRIDASLRDVFDRRGSDLLGFPLPGRTFALSLTVRSD